MLDERRRHRALAGRTRERILGVLAAAGRPMGIAQLAVAVKRHPNSVRDQLELLRGAGLVIRTTQPTGGRGRPPFTYTASPEAADAISATGARHYRSLAAVLADQLARLPHPGEASVAAGERWGSALARDDATSGGGGTTVDRLVAILAEAGFEPGPATPDGPLELRRCPFEPVARAQPGIVCGVHLGMVRGALATMGSSIDVERLDPFVTPDTCLVHLARRKGRAGENGQHSA